MSKKLTSLTAEGNTPLSIVGYFRIFLSLPDIAHRIEHPFYIISNLRSNCILGLDFIRDKGIIVDGNVLKILDSRKTKTVVAKVIKPNSFLSSIHKVPVMNQTLKFKLNLSHLTREIDIFHVSIQTIQKKKNNELQITVNSI